MMTDQNSPTLERLEDQIGWYDKKSQTAQRHFKVLKIAQIVAAAMLPLIAVFEIPEPDKVAAVLGLVVLVLEGAQQLNQYQQNWVSYRSTCEALKHEKYLFLAGAGPYAGAEGPMLLLADRIEGLISQEHAKWVTNQERTTKQRQAPSPGETERPPA